MVSSVILRSHEILSAGDPGVLRGSCSDLKQLCDAILQQQFWHERTLFPNSISRGSWLDTLSENKSTKELIIYKIGNYTHRYGDDAILRAGLHLVERESCLPDGPVLEELFSEDLLKICHRPSTDAAIRYFSTRLVEAARARCAERYNISPTESNRIAQRALSHLWQRLALKA